MYVWKDRFRSLLKLKDTEAHLLQWLGWSFHSETIRASMVKHTDHTSYIWNTWIQNLTSNEPRWQLDFKWDKHLQNRQKTFIIQKCVHSTSKVANLLVPWFNLFQTNIQCHWFDELLNDFTHSLLNPDEEFKIAHSIKWHLLFHNPWDKKRMLNRQDNQNLKTEREIHFFPKKYGYRKHEVIVKQRETDRQALLEN